MAKLTYTSVANKVYAQRISELRVDIDKLASWLEKSPGARQDVANQLAAFCDKFNIAITAAGVVTLS